MSLGGGNLSQYSAQEYVPTTRSAETLPIPLAQRIFVQHLRRPNQVHFLTPGYCALVWLSHAARSTVFREPGLMLPSLTERLCYSAAAHRSSAG